ncbi:MAG: CotH kinase family protein [Crocinitomicaceae bacterium]|nr:CotH kinase family protein [Crocinitomicaceae bacterium]
MRISGNATRGFPQKSIRISANKMYGEEKINYNFFGEEGLKKYTSLVLRNSGNDNTKTMFADLLMQTLVTSENVLIQEGQPVEVFLNGNYWGIYNIRERIDIYFIAKKEDVGADEVTLLESNGELKEGLASDKTSFDNFINEISNGDKSGKEMYLLADNHIDLSSFMDYIIYETFYGNGDWPSNNVQWYKAGNSKWKWILQDLDYGMAYSGKQNVEVNLFDKLKKSKGVTSDIFNALFQSEKFRNRFIDRANEIVESDFSEERITAAFEEIKNKYDKSIEFQIRRWRMIDSKEIWEENCQTNVDFLLNRGEVYIKQVEDLK